TTVDGVPVYLLGNDAYFDRDFLYGTSEGDYPDNHRRFAFFCRGALAAADRLGFSPDILHCHDWHTALVPLILRHEREAFPFLRASATVFTIHNLAYQGLFPAEALPEMGLSPALFTIDWLEFYGKVNLMKGGILAADSVTTVSESYCREILAPEEGCGLDGVLRVRRADLHGILNGLDYDVWNPATDRGILATYSADDAGTGKRVNKEELQRELGLEVAPDIPILAMVSRLSAQKGFDLLARILPALAGLRAQVVIVGVGDEKYLRLLRRFQRRGLPNLSITLSFAPGLAPKVYAGADIFIMPSRYEPCGLGQLIALRYGTVPVVRRTGGLADTVSDGVTGFVFDDYTAAALGDAVKRALSAYEDRTAWEALVRRGMRCDFSWPQSAAKYEALYGAAIAKKRTKKQ
ncbi:MAG TPA: glycogen/starch synthase, partial [Geobacteraceae bacterium]